VASIPKYSVEILVAQMVVAAACIVLVILDEYRSWVCLYALWGISIVIQIYRLERARKRLDRDTVQILQEIAKHRNRELTLHEPQHVTDEDPKGLREDIERHKLVNR